MKLSRRLDRLETPVREAWEAAWYAHVDAWEERLPAGVWERVMLLVGADPVTAAAVEAEMKRLDTWGLNAWAESWTIPDLERRDYHLTPATIPPPPDEPPEVLERYLKAFQEEGVRGDAAAMMLFSLYLARAVREVKG